MGPPGTAGTSGAWPNAPRTCCSWLARWWADQRRASLSLYVWRSRPPSNLPARSQIGLSPWGHPALMTTPDTIQQKVRAREAAQRLLARLTTGTAVSALAGVAVLGWVSAQTIPGNSSVTAASSTGTTSSSTSTTSSTSSSSSSGLSAPSGSVSSSSGSTAPVADTGGSRQRSLTDQVLWYT